jgi:hypothetical protein
MPAGVPERGRRHLCQHGAMARGLGRFRRHGPAQPGKPIPAIHTAIIDQRIVALGQVVLADVHGEP